MGRHRRMDELRERIVKVSNVSQFARDIGVDRVTVCRWINGSTTPDLETLRKAARILKCRVADIIGE